MGTNKSTVCSLLFTCVYIRLVLLMYFVTYILIRQQLIRFYTVFFFYLRRDHKTDSDSVEADLASIVEFRKKIVINKSIKKNSVPILLFLFNSFVALSHILKFYKDNNVLYFEFIESAVSFILLHFTSFQR